MHSFIVTGGDIRDRAEFIKLKLSSQIELIHLTTDKSSITIKQIHELNGPLSIQARLPRIVWIEEANLLTIPSQNALLKMLEEPPANTNFYLTCSSKSSLLSTILSRTKSIRLTNNISIVDSAVLTEIKRVMSLSPGDRITNIIKRDRKESITWICQIELALKDKLRSKNLTDNNLQMLAKIAKSALKSHSALLANCSVGLVTQNFYLTLPHTRSL
jgi:DNA polymerase III delta prime subunit